METHHSVPPAMARGANRNPLPGCSVMSAVVTIDDPDNGGSEPGAWAQAIEDTKFMGSGTLSFAADRAGGCRNAPAAGLGSPDRVNAAGCRNSTAAKFGPGASTKRSIK